MHWAQRLLVEEETVSHFWNYLLFAGGILFSVGLPVAVLAALSRCAFAYRRWRVLAPHALLLPALGRVILLLAALPAASIGGNPLGPRFSALVSGIAPGLAIALYAQLMRRPDTARAPSCPPWRYAGIEPSFGIAPAYPAGADSATASTHQSERQASTVADTQAYRGTFYSRPVYSFSVGNP